MEHLCQSIFSFFNQLGLSIGKTMSSIWPRCMTTIFDDNIHGNRHRIISFRIRVDFAIDIIKLKLSLPPNGDSKIVSEYAMKWYFFFIVWKWKILTSSLTYGYHSINGNRDSIIIYVTLLFSYIFIIRSKEACGPLLQAIPMAIHFPFRKCTWDFVSCFCPELRHSILMDFSNDILDWGVNINES